MQSRHDLAMILMEPMSDDLVVTVIAIAGYSGSPYACMQPMNGC